MTDRERKLFEIEVECYSGYKADEHPVSFSFNGFRFRIEEIIDRWHQAGSEPGAAAAEYFKVRTNDNKQCILKHEITPDRWFIWIKGESINLNF
jgi:hypothetical protein